MRKTLKLFYCLKYSFPSSRTLTIKKTLGCSNLWQELQKLGGANMAKVTLPSPVCFALFCDAVQPLTREKQDGADFLPFWPDFCALVQSSSCVVPLQPVPPECVGYQSLWCSRIRGKCGDLSGERPPVGCLQYSKASGKILALMKSLTEILWSHWSMAKNVKTFWKQHLRQLSLPPSIQWLKAKETERFTCIGNKHNFKKCGKENKYTQKILSCNLSERCQMWTKTVR